jgi:V/A-type H+-transporting ATPase subunit A
VDARCELRKQYLMLKSIMKFGERTNNALDLGVQLKRIQELKVKAAIGRMKEIKDDKEFEKLAKEIDTSFDDLMKR